MLKYLTIAAALIASPAVASDELLKVQQDVNLSVDFIEEQNGRDIWKIPSIKGRGDCEDISMLKRKLLIERGWDEKDLAIIIVYEKNADFKKKVVQAHVTLYVKSQNMILESTAVGNNRQNLYPEVYESYMKRNNYAFYCKVDNLDTKKQFKSAGERCGTRKKSEI